VIGFRFTPKALAVLAVLIFGSSVLGLTGRFFIITFDPTGGYWIFVMVWSASAFADALFVAGSAAAFLAQFALLARGQRVFAGVAGAALHWIVYAVSFMALPGNLRFDTKAAEAPADVVLFVLMWGFPGLLFAAIAPWIVATSSRLASDVLPARPASTGPVAPAPDHGVAGLERR